MLLLLVDQVMPTLWIVLILVFLIFTLLLALHFGRVYGYRTYRKWKEKIPNPSKSLLFQVGRQALLLAPGPISVFRGKRGKAGRLGQQEVGIWYCLGA